MEIRKPSYYDRFHCIAAACPDSCCQGWEVELDEETAQRYLSLPGSLGEAMGQCIAQEEGVYFFRNQNGRCPMWRSDGLCRLQARYGQDILSDVCREFPRMRHAYGDFLELGLELSCPEAARLILAEENWTVLLSQAPTQDTGDYDREAMALLQRTRPRMLSLLADPSLSVPQALAAALLYAYQVQGELDGADEAPFDPHRAIASARTWAQEGDSRALLDFYAQLEVLNPAWPQRLANPAPGPWSPALRPLAQYGVWRYYFQAVSDYDLAGRMKLVILHCLVTHLLGGDAVATASAYSKEIENDPDNMDTLLDAAYTHIALTDRNILSLLLAP